MPACAGMTKFLRILVGRIDTMRNISEENPKVSETYFAELRVLGGKISFSLSCMFALLGALLMPAYGIAPPFCVRLSDSSGISREVAINLGDTLRLKFRHSIYGSQVEEIFALRPGGFELTQLRYSEARLVDFYGYESAAKQNGLWVVTPAPTLIPALNVNLSSDAAMAVHIDRQSNSNPLTIQPTGALRLTVASCQSSVHD